MKQFFICVAIIALMCLSFAKQKAFTPPGTVQINDTLFADETEITNFSWMEYTWSVKNKYGAGSKEYIAALPDTTVWKENLAYNQPYVQHYFRHPAYKDYPVVGISYEQAVAYCKWRTDRVKTFLTVKKDFKNQNFEYRLPTKAEWEKLAETSSAFLSNNGKNEKGIPQLNCIQPDTLSRKSTLHDNADVTAPVKSYEKNFLGLYNMTGNVAEIIAEKGICKGGSWKNRIEECRIGKNQEYTKPTAWLGFRCVCIVKNNSNS